jgi:hypothetical protein
MYVLRQSTASQEIALGVFVDSTDGNTAETGLTIANTDIKIHKAGATTLANKNSGGATHISGGIYYAVLDATDTDTVGSGMIFCQVAGALAVRVPFTVLEEAVFDALYAASALGYVANAPVNVAQFGGSNGTFASGRPEVNTSHWAGTAVASAVVQANVAQISGDSVAADNLEAYCDGTTPQPVNVTHYGGSAGTFASGRPAVNTTHVNGTAQTARDIGASVLLSPGTGTGQLSITSGVVSANAVQLSGDSVAADNAEAFFDGTGYAGTNNVIPTVTSVTNLHASAATAAELAKVPKSDGTVTWNATALASIQSEANDALVAYDPPTKAELDAAVANVSVDEIQASALADLFNTDSGTTYASAVAGSVVKEIADNAGGSGLTAGAIADAVWDEALSGHVASGSTGEALGAAGGAGDPWITALPGAYSAGQAGYILGTNLNATVSSRASQTSVDTVDDLIDTEVAALTTELAKVPKSDGTATWNATALASLQQEATDALNAYDPPTRAELTSDTNSILTAVGDVPTNAELATALAAADDAVLAAVATVDTVVDAIKVKTDSLTFTTAGMVDSAIKRIGNTTLTAAGTGGQGYGG